MKKLSIAIIGHFGGSKHLTDGQTVKTENLYQELKAFTQWNIVKIDTYYNPIRVLFNFLVSLITIKDFIVILSANGRKFFFPMLYFCSIVFKKNIYHCTIGGRHAEEVSKNPSYKKYMRQFKANWVETNLLKEELNQQGIYNVYVIPNFRRIKPLDIESQKVQFTEPFMFCTFSRVVQEKGIEDAINAIQNINKKHGKELCRLTIYGPIDINYKERFETIMNSVSSSIKYGGIIATEQGINIICNFYAVLFPTYWKGESQAGTISESFFAGVPVIATDWRCNKEMITNGYNGLLYPSKEASNLEEAILWIISQQRNIETIKKNCLLSSYKYLPEKYIGRIADFIEKTNNSHK